MLEHPHSCNHPPMFICIWMVPFEDWELQLSCVLWLQCVASKTQLYEALYYATAKFARFWRWPSGIDSYHSIVECKFGVVSWYSGNGDSKHTTAQTVHVCLPALFLDTSTGVGCCPWVGTLSWHAVWYIVWATWWCYLLSSQYEITEHGLVSGDQKMMAEIYSRGPIACTVAVTAAFENYSGGIFNDTTGAKVSVETTSVLSLSARNMIVFLRPFNWITCLMDFLTHFFNIMKLFISRANLT